MQDRLLVAPPVEYDLVERADRAKTAHPYREIPVVRRVHGGVEFPHVLQHRPPKQMDAWGVKGAKNIWANACKKMS